MKPTHKERADFDSDGNRICEDCLAHVRPDLFQFHHCPPWLRMLVKTKKEMESITKPLTK